MNIAVIGLGLIGGSFCKAIKKYTDHQVFGLDTDQATILRALECRAIDAAIAPADLAKMDLTILCLHPQQTIEFTLEHLEFFKSDSLVIDSCGVKGAIIDAISAPLATRGVCFVGCHPMAGREFSGFTYALDNLYDGASFIMTPTAGTSAHTVEFLRYFAQKLQFGKVVISTPKEHDRVIAFTSQLAHVVSNAYIKSPSLQQQAGFSAGSFLDLTRVAKLNDHLWSELFMYNKESLLHEMDTIVEHIEQYKQALLADDIDQLRHLLKEGSDLKEESLKK